MSTMIAEIYEALIEAGASKEKAKAAASAMPVVTELATKTDIHAVKTDIQEVKTEIQEVWSELKLLKFAVFTLYPFILGITYRIFS